MRYWADLDINEVPKLNTKEIPGPKSKKINQRCFKFMQGYSSQVKLFPVVFEKGHGVTLADVDGNLYLDFSSGIYVTSLGHCHPKVSEAIAKYAKTLMNCHDFNTPVKMKLLEKLASIMPGDLNGIQFYDAGTAAVEAGLRLCRAATGRHEFISCYMDFHGKSLGAVSLARMKPINAATRSPGFYMVPRPYPYRALFRKSDDTIDTDRYIEFYNEFITEATTGEIAAFVLEPVQGWAGSIFPPDDFFPKLSAFLKKKNILLFADEVLTGMGRTGKWLAMEHWDTIPDVVTLGKGLGNGFPVTAMVAKRKYKSSIDKISASTSYGGNPMACAAALACIEVIEEEDLLERSLRLGEILMKRMKKMEEEHPIIGEVRGKGCLLGIELVKDRNKKEPFDEAGKLVYQKAFKKGLAWIPAGHILRMSPPIIMKEELALKGMDIIDEAIGDVEKEFGYK